MIKPLLIAAILAAPIAHADYERVEGRLVFLSESKNVVSVGTICIGGYLHAYIDRRDARGGVGVSQILRKTGTTSSPQPMKCEEE